MTVDNLYRAHSNNAQTNALDGFIPRKVSGKQVIAAMDHDKNPFTGKLYSNNYKSILEKRKDLPVFQQFRSSFNMIKFEF